MENPTHVECHAVSPPHSPHVSPLSCTARSSNSSVLIDGSGVAGGGDTERVGGGSGHRARLFSNSPSFL